MKYIGPRQFVGLQNYIDVFTRPDTLSSLKLSLYYMVGALIQVALALYLSTMLAFKVRGGSAFKAIYFFPYLINGIAVGFIFKFFYTRGYVFDTVLQWCGFQLDNLPYWLKDQSVNNWSLVGASVWRYLGQNVILFIGAMMSIDSTLYEAAEIDGATDFQIFTRIMLPAIRPILIVIFLFSFTGAWNDFLWPTLVFNDINKMPVTAGLQLLSNQMGQYNQMGSLMAATCMAIIPTLLLFLFAQKYFLQSLNITSGLKG